MVPRRSGAERIIRRMWQEQRTPVVGILIFDDVEVLDFAGPFEVLSAASRCTTLTVAPSQEVRCVGGLRVKADHTLEDCPPLDALIVPGGPGARENLPEAQAPLLRFIQDQSRRTGIVASVCTGAFLLGRAGLLDGRRATTHSARLELFAAEFPGVLLEQSKVVDLGAVATSAGVSSGIDLALHLLERWFGPEARRAEARVLDGPWV